MRSDLGSSVVLVFSSSSCGALAEALPPLRHGTAVVAGRHRRRAFGQGTDHTLAGAHLHVPLRVGVGRANVGVLRRAASVVDGRRPGPPAPIGPCLGDALHAGAAFPTSAQGGRGETPGAPCFGLQRGVCRGSALSQAAEMVLWPAWLVFSSVEPFRLKQHSGTPKAIRSICLASFAGRALSREISPGSAVGLQQSATAGFCPHKSSSVAILAQATSSGRSP